MSNSFSAQGGITIKRLRTGDSLFVSLTSDKPLYQAVDTDSGNVSPSWANEDNQPTITPLCRTSRIESVDMENMTWKWNSTLLVFNGDSMDGGFVKDATGKFAMDGGGRLKIVGDLASSINYANDTLTFTATAIVLGVEYEVAKSIDVVIQKSGASSYQGFVTADGDFVSADKNLTLTASLYLAGKVQSGAYVKWYKGYERTPVTGWNGNSVVTVGPSDVDGGATVFIAEFYASSSDASDTGKAVASAGYLVTDLTDEFVITYRITSSNKEVAENKPVAVEGAVYRMKDGQIMSLVNAVWHTKLMDYKWNEVRSAASNVMTISTADTDIDGQNDVTVIGEVSFSGASVGE